MPSVDEVLHRQSATQLVVDRHRAVPLVVALAVHQTSGTPRPPTASMLAGLTPDRVHVVGGGSENELLCQLTADACGLPVVAGPKEAAALGNVLVQARALGVGLDTLGDMRALLRRTQHLRWFEPDAATDWGRLEMQLDGVHAVESAAEPGLGS